MGYTLQSQTGDAMHQRRTKGTLFTAVGACLLIAVGFVGTIQMGTMRRGDGVEGQSLQDSNIRRALGSIDLLALRGSLPEPLAREERILVILTHCDTCPTTMDLPQRNNPSGIPAVIVTE